MPQPKKKKLDLKKCLIIGNPKRMKAGKPTITDRQHLSTFLNESEIGVTNIYMVLYRSEEKGFLRKNQTLITKLCEILMVKEKDLVVDF
ncbi:MAG: hypothetical protein V4547_16425 [Bacteroidota bacterium]